MNRREAALDAVPINPTRPYGRSLADFEPLKPAERKLLDASRLGEVAVIAETRPDKPTDDNTVRAAFLRFLLLGGDGRAPVHETGARLAGAWVEGLLDLEHCETKSATDCKKCVFDHAPVLRDSRIKGGVYLDGSRLPGLMADRARVDGGMHMRDGFTVVGEVRMLGAQIGGNLECREARFTVNGSRALSADRAVVVGGVFFNDGFSAAGKVRLVGAQIGGNLECSKATFDGKGGDALSVDGAVVNGSVVFDDSFRAAGMVRLLGIRIGGDLTCDKASFNGNEGYALSADGAVVNGYVLFTGGFTATGEVRLPGAQIGRNFECHNARFDGKGGNSLFADGMRVDGSFYFRGLASSVSGVSLASVSVGRLIDDARAWNENIVLDGFKYKAIAGVAPTDAGTRLAWLDRQRPSMAGLDNTKRDFRPQPWRQLQKVLREMGHTEDARQVGIAFEHRLRKADLIGVAPPHWGAPRRWLYRSASRLFHRAFWILTGYGYRPLRLLAWCFGVWIVSGAFYWWAALPPRGVFAPSNPLVFQNPEYRACVPGSDEAASEIAKPPGAVPAPVQGAGNWYLCERLREEYTTFSPFAYSLDVILPLVDLQQERDWAPMITTPQVPWWRELWDSLASLKHWTRRVMWFETLFGWLASLLLVAIVSGLTKRRED